MKIVPTILLGTIIAVGLSLSSAAAESWRLMGESKNLDTSEPTLQLSRVEAMDFAECKSWAEAGAPPYGFEDIQVLNDKQGIFMVRDGASGLVLSCQKFGKRGLVHLNGPAAAIEALDLEIRR